MSLGNEFAARGEQPLRSETVLPEDCVLYLLHGEHTLALDTKDTRLIAYQRPERSQNLAAPPPKPIQTMSCSGLPKQTIEQWEHTLSEAVSTGAAHISVYDLQVR